MLRRGKRLLFPMWWRRRKKQLPVIGMVVLCLYMLVTTSFLMSKSDVGHQQYMMADINNQIFALKQQREIAEHHSQPHQDSVGTEPRHQAGKNEEPPLPSPPQHIPPLSQQDKLERNNEKLSESIKSANATKRFGSAFASELLVADGSPSSSSFFSTNATKSSSLVSSTKSTNEAYYSCQLSDTEYYNIPRQVPKFVLIGVQKSGTTSLLSYFRDHPSMLQTKRKFRREAHFFDSQFRGIKNELKQFRKSGDSRYKHKWCYVLQKYMELFEIEQIISNSTSANPLFTFEKTPSYFCSKDVAYRMKATVPWSKIVLILRNPVDRAYSQYKMTIKDVFDLRHMTFEDFIIHEVSQMKRWNMTTAPLLQVSNATKDTATTYDSVSMQQESVPYNHAILDENYWTTRLDQQSHDLDKHMLIRKGIYGPQLKYWLEHYEIGKSMLIVQYGELLQNTEAVYRQIMDFANITYSHRGDISKNNQGNNNTTESEEETTGLVTNGARYTARQDTRTNFRPLSNSTRQYLQEFFAPYNAQLEVLLGKEWSIDKLNW